MKKIIYATAALLAFSSADLIAARQATPSTVVDHFKCTEALPAHALKSFENGKKDGTTVKEFKRCLRNADSATKSNASRYKNFTKAAEKILNANPEFAQHTMGK